MADGALLADYYPVTPYNFDVVPPPYLIGPIKSILQTVESRFTQLYSDIAGVQAQITVQTATGAYLDAHGAYYATPRLPGELDIPYRARILEAIATGRLTIFALQNVLNNYLASLTETSTPPVGLVYDLLSNPAKCAADAAAGTTVNILNFVVQVTYLLNKDEAFFLDYSYLDETTYLTQAGTVYGGASTVAPTLAAEINANRAGGTIPIYKTISKFH
jgi:hypothetical protein